MPEQAEKFGHIVDDDKASSKPGCIEEERLLPAYRKREALLTELRSILNATPDWSNVEVLGLPTRAV